MPAPIFEGDAGVVGDLDFWDFWGSWLSGLVKRVIEGSIVERFDCNGGLVVCSKGSM
jgi:hypothetical protein